MGFVVIVVVGAIDSQMPIATGFSATARTDLIDSRTNPLVGLDEPSPSSVRLRELDPAQPPSPPSPPTPCWPGGPQWGDPILALDTRMSPTSVVAPANVHIAGNEDEVASFSTILSVREARVSGGCPGQV